MSRLFEALHASTTPLFCDRFRQGPSYTTKRQHGSNDWLLIFTELGAGKYKTRLGSLIARPTTAVLYAPGDLHDYATDPQEEFWNLTWVHFLPPAHWEIYLRWPIHASGLRYIDLGHAEPCANFQLALTRMLEMSRRTIPKALDLAANALEEALLWAHIASDPTTVNASDERVRRATDYLSINLKKPFQSHEVAAHCGLSVSRISHLFKAQTGESPQQFHERQRLQHATQLL